MGGSWESNSGPSIDRPVGASLPEREIIPLDYNPALKTSTALGKSRVYNLRRWVNHPCFVWSSFQRIQTFDHSMRCDNISSILKNCKKKMITLWLMRRKQLWVYFTLIRENQRWQNTILFPLTARGHVMIEYLICHTILLHACLSAVWVHCVL